MIWINQKTLSKVSRMGKMNALVIAAIFLGIMGWTGKIALAVYDAATIDVGVAYDHHTYTRAVKMCDKYGSCLAQDFIVECESDRLLNLTAIGYAIHVPEDQYVLDGDWCP
jgi:hypothetical protein